MHWCTSDVTTIDYVKRCHQSNGVRDNSLQGCPPGTCCRISPMIPNGSKWTIDGNWGSAKRGQSIKRLIKPIFESKRLRPTSSSWTRVLKWKNKLTVDTNVLEELSHHCPKLGRVLSTSITSAYIPPFQLFAAAWVHFMWSRKAEWYCSLMSSSMVDALLCLVKVRSKSSTWSQEKTRPGFKDHLHFHSGQI